MYPHIEAGIPSEILQECVQLLRTPGLIPELLEPCRAAVFYGAVSAAVSLVAIITLVVIALWHWEDEP